MSRVIATPGALMDELDGILQAYHAGAVDSVKRNRHMNEIREDEVVDKRIVDAVLVDFMNRIAAQYCIDYAMYTRDLKS